MLNQNRNIVRLQWIVIATLLVGGTIAFGLLMNKTDQFKTERDSQTGNITSLREQVRQAKLAPKPLVQPLPEAVGNGPDAPSPTPIPAPAPTKIR